MPDILNTEKNNKIKFLDDFKQNKISASYDFNLDNNLKQINKNYIDLYGSYENFFTSLKYSFDKNFLFECLTLQGCLFQYF